MAIISRYCARTGDASFFVYFGQRDYFSDTLAQIAIMARVQVIMHEPAPTAMVEPPKTTFSFTDSLHHSLVDWSRAFLKASDAWYFGCPAALQRHSEGQGESHQRRFQTRPCPPHHGDHGETLPLLLRDLANLATLSGKCVWGRRVVVDT